MGRKRSQPTTIELLANLERALRRTRNGVRAAERAVERWAEHASELRRLDHLRGKEPIIVPLQ